jgi:mono/diheme cytochrome c family protein
MLRSHRVIAWILPRLLLGALMYTFPTPNADAASTGKQDFDANCASCHGFDGKGHGQALYVIPQVKPPDLTVLTKTNGGVFPTDRVYKSIDGRNGIPSHERFDMPFWGTTFQREGQEFTPTSEAAARARIMKIVDYIKSIQEK